MSEKELLELDFPLPLLLPGGGDFRVCPPCKTLWSTPWRDFSCHSLLLHPYSHLGSSPTVVAALRLGNREPKVAIVGLLVVHLGQLFGAFRSIKHPGALFGNVPAANTCYKIPITICDQMLPTLQPLMCEISSGDHYFLPSLLLRPAPRKPTFYTAQTEAF